MKRAALLVPTLIQLLAASALAQTDSFSLTLREAEKQALATSNQLKSSFALEEAADEDMSGQLQNLLPRLTLQGSYQYLANIPDIKIPAFGNAALPFGTNSVYSVGPQLNYTLWDTFASRDLYHASSLLKSAREEDRKNTELQLLAAVRSAYVQTQLGIEELTLINGSLDLAKAEDRDVTSRFHAGAADRLDVVTSRRSVLSYQIQFEQRQAQLSASLKDLLNLINDRSPRDVSHPGPNGVPGVLLALKLDSLKELLTSQLSPPAGVVPSDNQPQIRSQELQAQSLELDAGSQAARQYPTVQLAASVSENRPDIPDPPSYFQESVGVSLSLPLFLGDPSSNLAAEQRRQSEATAYRAQQLRDDLTRDFSKAREMLASLRVQRELSEQDVAQSEEEARLYFTSYKAGKINFIDVQNANTQSLTAKVSAARIDAQILDQIITLLSLAGEDSTHGP